ncbi:MAG: ribonuclease R [Bacteroidales bacterium]|nr:ribonuclease R [Bacteroidales bacterium]
MSKRKNSGRGRKERVKKAALELEGRVQMTREGFAFVIIEGDEADVFVKATKTCGALNGDIVKVVVTKEKTEKQRREGQITAIVQRSVKPFVGILHIIGDQAWVLMQSRTMPYDIAIPMDAEADGHLKRIDPDTFALHRVIDEEGNELTAKAGQKVAAVVDFWKRSDSVPTGHLVDVLGEPGENDTEMHAILAEFNLPYRFEPEVAKAADKISDKITEDDLKGRRDFRDTLTFTIDPTDAKDFDDALSFKKLENGNYEVGVHIADVTYYVRPGDIVDDEAKARGTSVYLVDRTVPMLPEKLSNKLCSLRPDEEKLTFSAVFEMTPLGRIVDKWFGRTVINSDYRFDYDGAQAIIMGDQYVAPEHKAKSDPDAAMSTKPVPEEIKEAVLILHKLAQKLRKKRFAAGAISFERPEMKVLVDEKGKPVDVYQKISFEANWLIEEFMLLANRYVAEFVAKECKKTFVFRVHDEPNQDKLTVLRTFAGNFGHKMGPTGNGKEISKSLNALFEEAKGTPEFSALELLSLRTMAKARYDVENIGHYGLAFPYYTHFTSPIRRYPDMMVHRLLARYLDQKESANRDAFAALAKHCSEREVIAAEAERASIKYKLVEFMQDKVGYEFEGHISGLTEWGMYVEVEPTKIEGMVALRDIRSDFFDFDEDNYRIVGRRSRVVYHLGDPVRIRVKKTNLDQVLLDYELIETGKESRADRRPVAKDEDIEVVDMPTSAPKAGKPKETRGEKATKAARSAKARKAAGKKAAATKKGTKSSKRK